MSSKVATMRDAVAELVRDGDTVAIEGFTHLISFAAGHEIIRQRKRDLVLARMTPDLVYDQMVAAGVARKLIFSWLGNPGVGGLNAIRRVTEGPGASLELEEYSHFGMVARYAAGAAKLPFMPLRSYFETDLPVANPLIRTIESPYGDGVVYAVPPLRPDVTVIHAQRADAAGNTQVWGLLGCQKEAAFAAERVIVVVEELVDEAVIRADPNRTIVPGDRRRRGGRRAVGRPPVLRAGHATTATTASTATGTRSAATRRPPTPGSARGSTTSTAGPPTWRSWAPSGSRRCARRARRRPASWTTGSTADGRAGSRRARGGSGGVLQVRDDDRGRRPRARRAARLLRRRGPAQHRGQPGQADGRPRDGARLRGRRLRRPAGPPPALDRRPDHRHRGHGRREHVGALRLLPPGRPGRRRLPGGGPDRPLRQHQHDRDRRLRGPRRRACRGPAGPARSRSTPARSS